MAWADDSQQQHADWEMELLHMRYAEGRPRDEPMELSPDPFYLAAPPPPASVQPTTTQPTLTSSASCPSFTSLYDIDSDDLLRGIPDSEPLGGEPLMGYGGGAAAFSGAIGVGPQMGMGGGYDYVLQFQQQHQNNAMRSFPHQSAAAAAMLHHDHMAVMQQSRRPLHMSASFTSLSSMETEYRRRMLSKRKKAAAERWNKAQRHKSFDSTNSSVATAPSPATSMEFTAFNAASNFEATPESHYLEELPPPRRATESDMIGFSIDDFPTTFTSDASWPMPPPLSLANGAPFEGFGDASSSSSSVFQSPVQMSTNGGVSDMDQLLLSDQERANVSSLLDAIRDFDAPLPSHPEEKASVPEVKRPSPTLASRPRPGSGQQQRTLRSPHLRGIARTDSGKRKDVSPASAASSIPTIRERIQLVLEKSSSSVTLLDDEQRYLAQAPQFVEEKAAETAGSLWLLIHASKCVETGCSVGGCDVMRRVVRHCRGCDSPLGKCRDPCNDAKAMLLHHATCKQSKKTKENTECVLCVKVQDIDRTHLALQTRPPLSPQLKPHPTSQLMTMVMPPMAMPTSSPLGGPVLIAPQPAFVSPTLKPVPAAAGGSKHVPIQPNPLPTVSNPMGMIGAFPHFGVSLALYLEQTAPAFRAEVKARVEKRVTNAAGQDLIQHMQKKTRLRSLEDLRSEARAIVLGEMERELHLHMQAVNWATVANNANASSSNDASANGSPQASSPPSQSDSGLPAYLLSVAAAGFAAFYAQQASLQAAMAGVTQPFGGSRQSLSRQSSTGSLTSSASSLSLSAVPLAPRKSASSSSLVLQSSSSSSSSSISPKESVPASDESKETPLAV